MTGPFQRSSGDHAGLAADARKRRERWDIFAEAAQAAPVPMIVADPALPGEAVVFANEAFLQESGYLSEEALGRGPLFMEGAGPEEEKEFARLGAALRKGRRGSAELHFRRKDGSAFPVVVFGCPFKGGSKTPKFIYWFERTAAAPAVGSHERLLQLFVNGVSEYSICLLDPTGRIATWNEGAERIHGYTAEEALGRRFEIFYAEDERRRGLPARALEMAARHGRFEIEGPRMRRDGSVFRAHVLLEAIRDETGRLAGFGKLTHDVTERRRALEAAQASEAKTQFLASMSHEIRTPLNGIIGYTERLMDEDLKPHQRRHVERIQTAGAALLTVIDDILSFSQIEAGRIELDEHPFSLERLLDNTISIVANSAEAKGLPVRLDMDPDLPPLVIGDEARVRQVLLNLMNNAIKFTSNGEVRLSVRREGQAEDREVLRFAVIDTGIGIPPGRRDWLFRRFSQLDASIGRQYGGSGLGLAISKQLVELMGGEIGCQSEVGVGSTFWFRLSLAPAGAEDGRAEEDALEFTSSARILVAEDLEINQDLVRAILEEAGQQVTVVSNGAEAAAALLERTYDLVLMDVQMPVMDGVAATRKIRSLESPARNVPIIAMTANVLPQQVRAFREAGMNDHVGKPMKRNDLLRKLRDWLPVDILPESAGDRRPQTALDESALADIRDLVGPERVSEWLKRLEDTLETKFVPPLSSSIDQEALRAAAHALVSQAGSLGFFELADRCRDLERACDAGGGFRREFERIRASARSALVEIRRLDRPT